MDTEGITKTLLIVAILLALLWNHIIFYFMKYRNRDKKVRPQKTNNPQKENTVIVKKRESIRFISTQGIVRLTLILCVAMIVYLPTRIEEFGRTANFGYRFIWELGLHRESQYSYYSVVPDIKLLLCQIFIAIIIGALCAASIKK